MRLLFFLSLLLQFSGSSAQTGQTFNNYYFPLKELLKGKSYNYVNQADSLDKTVWKLKATVAGKDTSLQTLIYNNGELAEEINELVHLGNSKFLSYNLFPGGNEVHCFITDSLVFVRNQPMGKPIHWSVNFRDPLSKDTVSISKTRELKTFDNKSMTFLDQMKVTVAGKPNIYSYTINCTYESGKGLVAYKIIRPNGQVKDFKLIKIN